MGEEAKRYAVVTGANKGIGFGMCKKLASSGIMVVLTARDEKNGFKAVEKLKEFGLSDLLVFHQLDVDDPASVSALADFIKTEFGKLDILVNNAAVTGGKLLDADAFLRKRNGEQIDWNEVGYETYELAEQCVETNFYGVKRVTEALLPLLQLSTSPRIVNISSRAGLFKNIPNEWARTMLSDIENLTREKIDGVLEEFQKDFKEGSLEIKGWPAFASAYTMSKAALNAYTRIMAKKYPRFHINSVCPGFVKTDMNNNTGQLSIDEGAETPVLLALLPNGGPSGCFFHQVVTGANKGIGFGICKQLVSSGITVVLTARDEKRGLEAVEKLKEFGVSDDQVVFHQLDVTDPKSIESLANFIKTQFGKLDILVNNAGIHGAYVDRDALAAAAGYVFQAI
ncbi:hypothetical protein JHK82_026244 [Glycine max]|nr:hypothetical protein JHK85_026861 [Glycine max]KAG5135056.1 hypothetical protein JHK82_026244 [Glycine max]